MKIPLFTGSGVALATPFDRDGVDYPALRRMLTYQLEAGTDAIIICGTTGEAATMSYEERARVIEITVEEVNGRVPVIAGTGSNSTVNTIALSRDAISAGADGLLVVTPFYNKATSRGLIRHFETVADSVDKPVILYNVPSRTGVKCTAHVYAALSKHPNIQGVKEASGDFALVQETRERCSEDFYIWSGNDGDTAAIMLLGGVGVVSVAANIVPGKMRELTHACLNGDFRTAGRMQIQLRRLCEALFWEVNPIPVKAALSDIGLCENILRLPLCAMEEDTQARLRGVLMDYGLL